MVMLERTRARPRRAALSPLLRLLLLGFLATGLMIVDQRSQALKPLRSILTVVIYPVQLVASIPQRIGRGVGNLFAGRTELQDENKRLRREVMLMRAAQEKYDALLVENNRLRKLFGAATRVADRALIAELVPIDLDTFTRKVVINKGSRLGIYVGQPVIDADGIMGQVTAVTPLTSVVTLITDPGHAVPVQVQRNGLRAILFGTGSGEELELPHLTATADVQEGDLLITSGMGGRFPAGYPVARIVRIVSDPNESFLSITTTPVAHLNHSKEVLLIWPGNPVEDVAAQEAQ